MEKNYQSEESRQFSIFPLYICYIYAYLSPYVHVYRYSYMCVYVYMDPYICVYRCVYTCIHIYTHTYISPYP